MAIENRMNVALFASAEYFESLTGYVPTAEFLGVIRGVLPPGWRIARGDAWFTCVPPRPDFPAQGWKLHVSATPDEAADVLRKTAAVLVAQGVAFKFALDPAMLRQMNGKNWSRGGSGKFITVYPRDDEQFRSLAEDLRVALDGHAGPYVLSDRRYRDSKVVYYRYGGLTRTSAPSPSGDERPTILAPDGSAVPDDRTPYFSLPPWVTDPFGSDTDEGDDAPVLRDGRYVVDGVLHFSNSGGVYLAVDTRTDERVVVKEARPHSGGDSAGYDSFTLLEKEYAVLEALAPTGLAPRPVELFREWEHLFLVEEYVPGLSLMHLSAIDNKLLVPKLDAEGAREFRDWLRRLWTNLAEALEVVHAQGIVLGDLQPRNVLVDRETLAVRFIDFEAALRIGVDRPTHLSTPGFASAGHRARGATEPADDYYALGAVMLASTFLLNTISLLDPTALHRLLATFARELSLPTAWTDVIAALLDDDPAKRPAPAAVVAALADPTPPTAVFGSDEPAEPAPLDEVVEGIVRHVIGSAEYGRRDRLYPADARVFVTNPLAVAHGAAGIAYALHGMSGDVPTRALAWMLSHDVPGESYPTGLYVGTAGIAWVLAELGVVEPALRMLEGAAANPGRFATPGVYEGAAGYGLARLRFWGVTGDARHLDEAIAAGEHLLRSRVVDGDTSSWPGADGLTRIGYPYGASGIALFLLYLHLATGDRRYLDAGSSGLAFDLSFGVERDGLLTFPQRTDQAAPLFPYWDNGSAGVGTALVRYYAATGDETYRKAIDPIALDCSRRFALMPNLFRGLAGLGNFLLDCHQLLGDEQFREESLRVADGVRLFALDRPTGIAFPGDMLQRVSTDFGSGSAGIGMYLHRLARNGPSFNFTLDALLPGGGATS